MPKQSFNESYGTYIFAVIFQKNKIKERTAQMSSHIINQVKGAIN
jgi:hypothetical protein